MGLESCGAPGTTAALALLNDAVKKGGLMASSHVGGLSGAFIPVSEDAGMIDAVSCGSLSIEKLEAMTCVCSVGLDMIAIAGDTPAATISGIIADEAAIGMINNKLLPFVLFLFLVKSWRILLTLVVYSVIALLLKFAVNIVLMHLLLVVVVFLHLYVA